MYALFKTIDLVLNFYLFVLIGAAVFSWLYAFHIVNPHNNVVRIIGRFFYSMTEPVLKPIRRVLPNFGSVDISPLVVFLIIFFIQNFMWSTIYPLFV
ncbi:MAG: YggT family protein [Candidatus Tokpelaia sp.]|uniref:YggT family protein n=1 Tax=Candidatus Tokpelaia sp. TaxID=2233777 RepID=UPI0012385CB3|nr:YggT family protein [Candidatus Tokpelaia sp.]KAA6205166.1 MAG: YggT family protein [Candidatus Tokpelaia sp.]KAA6207377.1 MAG: YggT family protein [Candidatus Tokpelaia sp.]KAA6405112.1 YggT family protein [Candidatus Tokpelaia sp.]